MVSVLAGFRLPFVIRDPAHFFRLAVTAEIVVEALYGASVGAEIIVTAVKQDIFAQRAFQRTVKHRNLDGGLQADIVEILRVRAYQPCVPSREITFQICSDGAEHLGHVLLFQTMVVRRVHHQASGFGVVGPVGHWLAFHFHHVLHLCVLDVAERDGHGVGIDVAAIDLESEGTFGAVVIVEVFEKLFVEVGPFFESEAFAVYAGIDVGGDQCGLYQECAGSAHRVGEIGVAAPACGHYYAGGQHFVDRGFRLFLAVAALVKRFAAGIQRDGHAVAVDVDVEQQVIARHAYRGPYPVKVAEMVHDAVLHAVGGETAVGEIVAVHGRVDSERGLRRHVFLPRYLTDYVVKFVRIRGCEFLNGLQHPEGCAQAQIRAVHQFKVSLETYHAGAHLHVLGAEAEQFVT